MAKEVVKDDMFTAAWYNEMWGRIVVGIGSGNGRGELIGIIQYVAQEQFYKGQESKK